MRSVPPFAAVPSPYRVPETTVAPVYEARLARSAAEVEAAQRLRFEVFNLELGEGLVHSYGNRLDVDEFDAACDHLLVFERAQGGTGPVSSVSPVEPVGPVGPVGRVVGTYRLQTGTAAGAARGYYSEREFDFTPFERHRTRIVELGRACVHAEHRSFAVLGLLWRGIASYALARGARYLVGCSSLTSLDEAVGAAAWQRLRVHAIEPELATVPRDEFTCSLADVGPPPKIPRLLTAYLALGAKVCGPPAIDREFGTIDFLTWLDLEASGVAEERRRARFVRP